MKKATRLNIEIVIASLALLVSLLALICGCTPLPPSHAPCALYAGHGYQNQFPQRYPFHPDVMTEGGIRVDTSGVWLYGPATPPALGFSAEVMANRLIDRQVDEVETCLRETFPGGQLPPELIDTAHCDWGSFQVQISRGCLNVKVAPDAMLSADETQEVLPATGPVAICIAKGLCPVGSTDVSCPCHVRAGIQDNAVIVVAPSAYLLKDPLIRMVTGCNNPWVGELAKCAAPTVPPLSGLVTKKEPQ